MGVQLFSAPSLAQEDKVDKGGALSYTGGRISHIPFHSPVPLRAVRSWEF